MNGQTPQAITGMELIHSPFGSVNNRETTLKHMLHRRGVITDCGSARNNSDVADRISRRGHDSVLSTCSAWYPPSFVKVDHARKIRTFCLIFLRQTGQLAGLRGLVLSCCMTGECCALHHWHMTRCPQGRQAVSAVWV
jgi:hypothetical protein